MKLTTLPFLLLATATAAEVTLVKTVGHGKHHEGHEGEKTALPLVLWHGLGGLPAICIEGRKAIGILERRDGSEGEELQCWRELLSFTEELISPTLLVLCYTLCDFFYHVVSSLYFLYLYLILHFLPLLLLSLLLNAFSFSFSGFNANLPCS